MRIMCENNNTYSVKDGVGATSKQVKLLPEILPPLLGLAQIPEASLIV